MLYFSSVYKTICPCDKKNFDRLLNSPPGCCLVALRVLAFALMIAGIAVFVLGIIKHHFICLMMKGTVLFLTGVLYFSVEDWFIAQSHNDNEEELIQEVCVQV